MNPLKSPHALLLLAGLFSIDAHAGAVSPNLHYGMQDGENRGVRFFDGGVFRLDEIDCMSNPESCVHKVAWYRDRDNSMSPVSTESGVGAAMAAIFSKNGVTQAIKFCPEVYLATAHGVLGNPKNARKDKITQEISSGDMYCMSLYTLSKGTIINDKNDIRYLSQII